MEFYVHEEVRSLDCFFDNPEKYLQVGNHYVIERQIIEKLPVKINHHILLSEGSITGNGKKVSMRFIHLVSILSGGSQSRSGNGGSGGSSSSSSGSGGSGICCSGGSQGSTGKITEQEILIEKTGHTYDVTQDENGYLDALTDNPWKLILGVEGSPPYTVEQKKKAVDTAREKKGRAWYDLFSNNCEHFVNFCLSGIKKSYQIVPKLKELVSGKKKN